jgi:hypothetical protein
VRDVWQQAEIKANAGMPASWSNPGVYHHLSTLLIGWVLVICIKSPAAAQPEQFFKPLPVPIAVPAPTPAGDELVRVISQVQQQVVQNDVRGAAKTLRAAREALGKSAELASRTCQIRLLLGRKQAAKKACHAALALPFQNQDSYWKGAAFDGLAALFENIGDVDAAIQAARMALHNLEYKRRGIYYLRLIQLLGRRGSCADLHEARRIIATEAIPGPQLVLVQSAIRKWGSAEQGKYCDYAHLAHLPPAIQRFLLHPEEAMAAQAGSSFAAFKMADRLFKDGSSIADFKMTDKAPTAPSASKVVPEHVDSKPEQVHVKTLVKTDRLGHVMMNLGEGDPQGTQGNAGSNASNVSSTPAFASGPVTAEPLLMLVIPRPLLFSADDSALFLDNRRIDERVKAVQEVMVQEMQRVSNMRFDGDQDAAEEGEEEYN